MSKEEQANPTSHQTYNIFIQQQHNYKNTILKEKWLQEWVVKDGRWRGGGGEFRNKTICRSPSQKKCIFDDMHLTNRLVICNG